MPISRRRQNAARALPKQQVLARPAPKEHAEYGRSQIVGSIVILDWFTAYGAADLAHPLSAGNSLARWLGLSQRQLAERAGMTQPGIARFEAGGIAPTLPLLERLAMALSLTLNVSLAAAERRSA